VSVQTIGVPREIKNGERRVALTPSGADVLIRAGKKVLVETNAGVGSGFDDTAYVDVGATVIATAEEVWRQADLIVKVKEPLPSEYDHFRPGQVLFTYLHLAGVDPALTTALLERRVTAVGYETVQLPDGGLPLLAPMSAIAGRLAIQVGARYLQANEGGRGVLLGGVPGVVRGHVVVIGAGSVGRNAVQIAAGMGARVTALDIRVQPLIELERLHPSVVTQISTPTAVAAVVATADLLVSGVLVVGGRAPTVISAEMIRKMRPGSVILDVAIDQGGSVETMRPTSHTEPTFSTHGVVHYAVPNMPGAVPITATLALTNATLPYIQQFATLELDDALAASPELAAAVNTRDGAVVHPALSGRPTRTAGGARPVRG
jgi:alanine dehydrogenase